MWPQLSPAQQAVREEFRRFARRHVVPAAAGWDRRGGVPRGILASLRRRRYLGAPLPRGLGGGGLDAIAYGLLTEEIGRGCSSLRSLLTVHDMVATAVARWGGERLRREVLPRLARGEALGALALSEPGVGSDAAAVETTVRRRGDDLVLDGEKWWITFGQWADWFLVLGRDDDGASLAVLVPVEVPGLSRRPIRDVVGTRAARLAELRLESCRVPADHLLGRPGFGFSHVVSSALDLGRYSVAWGAVGIAQACLDASLDHAAERRQFGRPLAEHALVQRELTEMIANVRAARLLCYRAGSLRDARDPSATAETMVAKYFASRAATRAANAAVQLHGALGLAGRCPVERYLRDARVTEIIEGSTQIQQMTIPRLPLAEL